MSDKFTLDMVYSASVYKFSGEYELNIFYAF